MNVAVIGCGYIGSEVAMLWKNRGLHITATTRRPEKLKNLTAVAQKGVLLKGNDLTEFLPLLTSNEIILVTIGADAAEDYTAAYRNTAQFIRSFAVESDLPKRLIYTSSASVYGDHQGKWVDEESQRLGKTEQEKILIETEDIYRSLIEFGWNITILRLAEIYGPERELSKKVKQITRPLAGIGNQYTNLIHKTDCVSAIDYCLRHHLNGIYNLVDDDHPTRKELYQKIAKKFHLPEPQWDPALTSPHAGNKRVSNHKIKGEGFVFMHPHRVID